MRGLHALRQLAVQLLQQEALQRLAAPRYRALLGCLHFDVSVLLRWEAGLIGKQGSMQHSKVTSFSDRLWSILPVFLHRSSLAARQCQAHRTRRHAGAPPARCAACASPAAPARPPGGSGAACAADSPHGTCAIHRPPTSFVAQHGVSGILASGHTGAGRSQHRLQTNALAQ